MMMGDNGKWAGIRVQSACQMAGRHCQRGSVGIEKVRVERRYGGVRHVRADKR